MKSIIIKNLSSGEINNFFIRMNYNFFLKRTKDKQGLCPIYLNVNIDSKRRRIPVDLKVAPEFWDQKRQKVISCDEARDYNLILKQIESKITDIKIQHRLSETPLTMEKFIEHLKFTPPSYDLVQFFNHVIEFQDISKSTVVKHKGIFSKLKNSKISSFFPDITIMWFDRYRKYLRDIGNNTATINTNISIIKKYLKMAKDNGIKLYVNLDQVRVGSTAGRIVWLKKAEIEKLEEYYYSNFIPPYLKLTLGYFLFSCYTGLRISDVLNRTPQDFETDMLEFISKKTGKRQLVGISQKCRKIIEEDERLFVEKKAEVNMNLHLKTIAKTCGIAKNIFFHVARHSFATNYLIQGGKVENLQKLLGHSKITTTMKYVHIIDEDAAITVSILD